MKKLFFTAPIRSSNIMKPGLNRTALEINKELSQKKAAEVLKRISLLPEEQKPKPVDQEQLQHVMDEFTELRKDSVY